MVHSEGNKKAYGVKHAGEGTTSVGHIQKTKRLHSSVGYYFEDTHSIAPVFYNLCTNTSNFTGHRGP